MVRQLPPLLQLLIVGALAVRQSIVALFLRSFLDGL